MRNVPRGRTRYPGSIDTYYEIPNLELHLDANSIVGNDGDAVSIWHDQSGKLRDFSQATESKRPLLKKNIINGQSVVRFDGTDDYLTCGINDNILGTALTITIVFAPKDTASGKGLYSFGDNPVDNYLFLLLQRNAGDVRYYMNGSYRITTAQTSDAFKLHTLTWNGELWSLFINGAAGGTYSGGANQRGNSNLYLGSGYNGYAYVDIAEFYMYSRTLDDSDRTLLENKLIAKYGL